MLKKLVVAALLFAGFSSFAAACLPDFTSNKKPIEVKQGQSFVITLQSNPTTGFSWQWKSNKFDQNVVALVDHKYVASKDRKLVGAPGYEIWTFKAKPISGVHPVTQVGHIVMVYQRPWEKHSGMKKTFVVQVASI